MRWDIGRFFEGRISSVVQILKGIHDLGLGAGPNTLVWIEGREMVIGCGSDQEPPTGPGFLRAVPHEAAVTLAFPRGSEIPDPLKRSKGVPGSRKTILLRHTSDIDSYIRRMIDVAYSLETP